MHMNRDMNRPALRVDASAYPAGAALLSASGVPDVALLPMGGVSHAETPDGTGELSGSVSYSLLPGFCDVHVHFREPGYSYKETIRTGTQAAARGGYTAVCTMPNLDPVPDSPAHLRVQTDIIRRDACIAVYPYGALTVGERGTEPADLAGMAPEAVAFSDDGRGVQSADMMRSVMREAARLGKVVAAHCEDNSLLHGGYIHDGRYASEHGHRGISSESEWREVERDCRLARETGCKLHICHVSTKESVDIIRKARDSGADVTAETAPHYLLLCDEDLQEDGRFKMNPPLRSRADRDALLAGITDGTIEVIATDHAPHTAAEKSRGLAASAMGVVGLECAFPLLYKYMVLPGIVTLEKLVALMAVNPRRIFGLGGGLHVGDQADFTVLDLDARYRVDPATFLSMGRATPFAGWEVQGRAAMTVVGGREVFRDETMKTNR